jgi:hypothetical protein
MNPPYVWLIGLMTERLVTLSCHLRLQAVSDEEAL